MTLRVRCRGWWRRFRAWWTARGVIPRWQLLLVYALIVTAGAIGMSKTSDAASKAKDAADETHHLAATTNAALCALRRDLEVRVTASLKFLDEHPEGFAGVPAAQIRTSVQGQQHTIAALSGLKC